MKKDWKAEIFERCITPIRVDRTKQIMGSDYLTEGLHPIIDQGKGEIAGWTNNDVAVISHDLPYIIFGDHTRIFKYVNFPFALGADGTQLIKPRVGINPRYFYYALLSLDIPSRGYSRHYRILKETIIPLPPFPEQEKIAAVLSKLQQAISAQDKIIRALRDLKKSTMQHLFTRGLRGEKTKSTAIGEMPESWEINSLDSLVVETDAVNMLTDRNRWIKYIDVSGVSSERLTIVNSAEYMLSEAPGRARKRILKGDVIFATIRPTLHRIAWIDEIYHEQVCSTAFCVLRNRDIVADGRFIYYLVQRPAFIEQLSIIETGASYPAVTDRQVKNQLVPIPSKKEQALIANSLFDIDQRIEVCIAKYSSLQDLFKTTLNKLITGDIRIADLDIDIKGLEA